LDPPADDFKTVFEGAKSVRELLETALKLPTFVMTTGSKGLHNVVPLNLTENFDVVRAFVKNIAQHLCIKHPNKYTVSMRKDQREGKLFIDYIRNSYWQTAVCPFSVRAIEGTPVATPLSCGNWKTNHSI
jgi:bifunctional non-homologous end joining protein LigD